MAGVGNKIENGISGDETYLLPKMPFRKPRESIFLCL